MRCIIRTDASQEIGTGHAMRCHTLAQALRRRGVQTTFLCQSLKGDMTDFLSAQGFSVFRLAAHQHALDWQLDASQVAEILQREGMVDWLLVDHYALDARWESSLRPRARRVVAIDDLADRKHDCDLLLDQNLFQSADRRYDGLLPPRCVQLLGPHYALLREEFTRARSTLRLRDGQLRRVLISFGGADPGNATAKALEAVAGLANPELAVDVVVGASNPHRQAIEDQCRKLPQATFICQANNMAELMARADLAIGAGGSTTWERCCLALPSLTVVLADNQRETTLHLHELGATHYIGEVEALSAADYGNEITRMTQNPALLSRQSEICRGICDGQGADRVAEQILRMTPATTRESA